MFFEIIFAVILSGLIALDSTAIIQIMLSQPIVAAPLIGYCIGDFSLGLIIGIATQLLWISSLQIGAAIVPNSSIASLLISIVSITIVRMSQMSDYSPFSICGIVFIAVIPLLAIEERSDTFIRKKNYIWFESVQRRINRNNFSLINLFNIGGAFFFFLKNVFFLGLSVFLLLMVLPPLIMLLPSKVVSAFGLFFKMVPVVGISAVLAGLLSKKYYFLFAAGMIVQMIVLIFAINYE